MKSIVARILFWGVVMMPMGAAPSTLPQPDPLWRLPSTMTLDFIRQADTVYVYHAVPNKRPNDADLHRVDGPARAELLSIFTSSSSYYQGCYSVVDQPAFGVEFRKGKQRFDLEWGYFVIWAQFDDKAFNGAIHTSARRALLLWFKRYEPALVIIPPAA